MVDFRYHLVSIIAIFLALALGIVVGTTQLNGQVLDSLNSSIGKLASDKRALEGTVGTLRDQVASDEKVVDSIDEAAVAGALAGQRVILLSTPDAPARMRDDLATLVEGSGAVVTGKVQLRPDLLDPARSADLDRVVGALPGSSKAAGATAVERAAALLAGALVRPSGDPGPDRDDASAVVAGLEQADLLAVDGDLKDAATLAVVLAGAPAAGADPVTSTARTRAALTVATTLKADSSGCVLAGPTTATEPGGLLSALRADSALTPRLSSVDGADRASGRVATVFALREQVGGKAGQYGTGPGSSGPLPATPTG